MGVFDKVNYFDEPAAPTEPGLGDLAVQGLRSGLYQAKGQVHKLAGTVMDAAGMDGSTQNAKSKVANAYAQAEGRDLVPLDDVHDVRSGLRWAAGTAGQIAPLAGAMVGASLATGGGAVAPLAAGTALQTPLEIGGHLQRQEQDPANRYATPGERLATAGPVGLARAAATNIIPAGVASRMVGGAGRASMGQIALRGAADVPAQAAAMGAAEGMSQVGDNVLNPEAGYDVGAMGHAAKEGAAMGAMFGAAGAAGHAVHSSAGALKAAPGRAFEAAKGLVPDSVKDRLSGAKEAAGEAADAATTYAKDGYDATAEAAAKAAEWAKGTIKAKVADVQRWGQEFMADEAAPESFKAMVQDAIRNPGDKAKQLWMATQKFTRDAAAKAQDAVEKADVPTRLRALHKDMADKGRGLMDRMARGEEVADTAEILAAGDDADKATEVFAKADQTAAAKAKEWGEQMLNEHLGEEKTAQLKQWLADVGDKASQTGIAGMKVAHDAAKYTADKAQKFAEKAKATEAGAAAQVAAHVVKGKLSTKKSEALPEGMRERIGEAIMDVLGDDHPLLDSGFVRDRDGQVFTPLQHLADGLRAVMTSAAEGRPVSSDALAQLYDIAGSKTRALIDAVHSAVGEPAADKASFFAAVNAAVDAGKGKDGVIATMQKSLKPELQDAVRPHELKMEAEMLREWMTRSDSNKRAGVQKTLSEAEVTHRDALIREALEHRYGTKAEAVLVAIRKEIGKEENLKDSGRKTSMDSDDDMREPKDPNAAGEREFNAKDESVRTHYFPQNGQLYLSPEHAAASQFADAATQRINTAKKENPDANVVFRRVSELDESDPKVKAMVDAKYEDLVDLISNDPNWRDLGDPEDLAAKELEKYGLVVAEQSKQETSISAGELDKLRLDTKNHSTSPARLDTGVRGEKGNVVIDAIKLTEFMNAKMRDAREYSPIDDLGPGYRDARMFMEGVAAVSSRLGRGFKIPDETKITRQGLTWGEARKLDPRSAKDKAYDADSPRIQASGEEFAMASTRRPARKGEQMSFGEKGMDRDRAALAEDVAREKTRDIRAAREWDLLREQTMDENRMQSTDKTGYEGEVERGIHTEKRAAREELRALEATIAEVGKQLDGEVAFGRDGKEEVALRQQLGWLNTAKDALQARIAKMVPENRPSGRRAIDPFGPTHDALRGSEEGNPIHVNADGSARGDTVMGRRRPAQHDPRAEVLEPAPANAREGKALAAARQRANVPVPIDNEKALRLKLRRLDEVLRKDMTRKEAAALQRVHGMSPEAREELVNRLYDKYVAGEPVEGATAGEPVPAKREVPREEDREAPQNPPVVVVEHPSPNYGPRTKHNADAAGLTVAIASDFTTAGEKLTARVAEGKYLGIPLDVASINAGTRIAKAMRALETTTLNVAGNGIYTLDQRGITQSKINQHVYEAIKTAHELLPITKVVTGGQTGVDIAGAVAARALGIPVEVTMPKGLKQRGVDGVDRAMTAAQIERQIETGAKEVTEGPPSPKAVAAKKAAFLEKTRSGDPELLQTLKASDNAKGLQRALEALKNEKGENAERVIDAINRRLVELIKDPDVRYGLQTKKYSLERGDAANDESRVLAFPDRVGQRIRASVEALVNDMSDADFHTLQNDVLARDPNRRKLPAVLSEDFREWLSDYRSAEREDMMSPERQGETERQFLEEYIDQGEAEPLKLALAQTILSGATLKKLDATKTAPGQAGPINRAEVLDYLGRVHGPNVQLTWKNMMHAGEFERTATADVIRLSVHSLNPLSAAYHEALHGFMAKLRDDRHADIAAVLDKAGSSAPVMNQLRKLLANEPDALKQLSDPEERVAYMYQFWAQGKLKLGEKATNIFQRIANFLREVTGMWTNDQRAEKIMEYFHSGEYEANRAMPSVVHRALMEAGTVRAWEKAKAMTEPLREMGEALASAGGTRLRDTGIPALRQLADAMKLKTTTEGQDPGFLPAARSERARIMNQIGRDLKGYTPDQIDAALHQLQTGVRSADVKVRSAAATVSKHLDDALSYMQAAGVKIEHLGMTQGVPYFPRSWDASYISSHQKEFQAMLAKYPQLRGDPHKLMQKLMVTDGAEFGVEVDKPGMQHSKERVLSFISHADAAPFMRKDLYQILNSYVTQATRRAEWARRFGDDGSGVSMMLASARKQGATDAQLEAAQNFIRSVDGTLGDTINPVARRAMGDMIVYQNIRLLPLAIFSSLVDSQGIMVRGGTVGEAFSTFKRGMKEVVKNFQKDPKSDAMTDLAEAIGTIDNAHLVHTLGASYSQGMVGDRGRAINDTFFRLNLMEQYNSSMRVGATEAALNFIARHATKPGEHSERYLRELGLSAADVKLDAHGRPKVLESDGLSLMEAAKMKAAVNRWVDGAVLRPDAVDKPIWMSDPHYALVAHLKQFVYSFHETILKRVVHEAQHGNYAPGAALASYVPMMLAADMVKGIIQGGGEQPDWKDGWGPGDYLWSAMERAGLFGTGQFAIDALSDVQRGGSGVGALSGPTVEQLTDAVRVMGGREHFKPFAVKSMPANALYGSAFEASAPDPKFVE